jgi:hypothetical protein
VLDLGCRDRSFPASAYPDLRVVRLERERPTAGVQADAARLPFPDGNFATVPSNHSLEHMTRSTPCFTRSAAWCDEAAAFMSVPDASTFLDRLYRWSITAAATSIRSAMRPHWPEKSPRLPDLEASFLCLERHHCRPRPRAGCGCLPTALWLTPQAPWFPAPPSSSRNEDTGASYRKVSDAAGEFGFEFLPVGTYTLRIEGSGFKALETTGIVLTAGQQARPTHQLQLGGITETVKVEGSAALLNTVSAEQQQSIDSATFGKGSSALLVEVRVNAESVGGRTRQVRVIRVCSNLAAGTGTCLNSFQHIEAAFAPSSEDRHFYRRHP